MELKKRHSFRRFSRRDLLRQADYLMTTSKERGFKKFDTTSGNFSISSGAYVLSPLKKGGLTGFFPLLP